MKRIEVILERKVRRAFLKKRRLRGPGNEFGGMPAKILGSHILGRANSECQVPGEEEEEDHCVAAEQRRGRVKRGVHR